MSRSRGPWRLLAGKCAVMLGIASQEGSVAILGHRDAIRPADAAALVQADALAEACALFTNAAKDAASALNGAGLPCPSSIASAAEKARNALAEMHRLEAQMVGEGIGASRMRA